MERSSLSGQPTVSEVWENYLERHARNLAPAGQVMVAASWRNLSHHFGSLMPGEVNQRSVDHYVAARVAGHIGRPSVPSTARRELAYLAAALRLASKHKLISHSDIEPVEVPDASPPRSRWLTIAECQRLLDAAYEMRRGDTLSRLERFIWLALETGARRSAIMDLHWSQVDFELGVVDFAGPDHSPRLKRRAALAISKALRPVLERAHTERLNDLVMTNKGAIWNSMQRAAVRAGFSEQKVGRGQKARGTGISPHVLRHTAATHMVRRGVPLWVVAKCLGNSVEMIERVYGHWRPAPSAESTDLISNGELRSPL